MEPNEELHGRTVVDRDGETIGDVEGALSGQEAWVTVKGGLLGRKQHAIPVDAIEERDGDLHVPFSEDQVKSAPPVKGELNLSQENGLREHYAANADAVEHDGAGRPVQPDGVPVTHDEDSPLRDPERGTRPRADQMVRPEKVRGVQGLSLDEIHEEKRRRAEEEDAA